MTLDSQFLAMISSFIEIACILLFLIAVVGAVGSAISGYRRGVYRATYKMLGLALFLILALVTIKPLMNVIFNFDISGFISDPIEMTIGSGENAVVVQANATTVEATLTDLLSSFCSQVNASQYVGDVTQLIKTLVVSIVTFFAYFVDLFLIVTVGNGLLDFFWLIIFRKAAPKIAKKFGQVRVLAAIESAVSYLVLFFLFLTPFTSIFNAVNQGLQKSNAKDSQNANVQEVIKLVDIYNDSLFAKAFFNWNPSVNEGGLTFDTLILNYFSTTANDGVDTISIGKELESLVTAVGTIAGNIGEAGENNIPKIINVDLVDDMISSTFDIVASSDFLTSLMEVSIKLALDSTLLESILPNSEYYKKVSLDDFSIKDEIEVLKHMSSDIVDSGIIEDFVDLNTMALKPQEDIIVYLDNLFTLPSNRGKVDKILNVFNRLDEFKLLNNAIQSLGYWGITNDSSYTAIKYLGGTIDGENTYKIESNKTLVEDFVKDINIGHEMNMMFDALWGLASCGEHVIKNAYYTFVLEETEDNKTLKETAKTELADTLRSNETTAAFRDAITGFSHMKADGTAPERDGSKGEHYALLDCQLITKFINTTPFMKNMLTNFEENMSETYGESFPEAKTRWSALMNTVYDENSDTLPIKFFKTEFESLLKVITNIIQLEVPTTPTTPTPAPLKVKLYEEDSTAPVEEEKEPFEYKDYNSFVMAALNLFDGWIDLDGDVLGSIFGLDSRIAPYISKFVECLKPFDSSEIIYALGIPLVTNKLAGIKDDTQDFFDVQICIDQINGSHSFFADFSSFLDADMVNILQHFFAGFLINDEGKFDISVLTDSISNDPGAFLDKLNEKIVIKSDDPTTPEDETKIDTHPLKYYFAGFIKSFYNFEIFNPQTGTNKNKNIESLFNYIFSKIESFGIETPSAETYATLDTAAKWEAEIDSLVNIFAVIGENKMLKFGDFSSSINSTLLYCLAGDISSAELQSDYSTDMPRNLGDVLDAVGDSVLLSKSMGSLLDQYLDGTLCDIELGVKFGNLQTGEYWKQEAQTMSDLLGTIARLNLDLENLDFTQITDVIGLNDMLHSLSNSLIFNDNGTNQFGEWLYGKVSTALNSMSGGLLTDPDDADWDSSWDTIVNTIDSTKYPTEKIAHYDFIVRDGVLPTNYADNKAAWAGSSYATDMNAFKTTKNYASLTKTEINDLYKTPGFMDDYYDAVLKNDEIGRLVNVLGNGIKIMDGGSSLDFTSLSAENLNNILTAMNNTNCLRICAYNAMSLAKSSIGSNDFVNINAASFDYLITTGEDLDNYADARTNRQQEIDHIVNFYGYYKDLQDITGSSLDASAFFNKAKLQDILGIDANGIDDPSKTDVLTNMLAELEATKCFHLEVAENRSGTELSFFEGLIKALMTQSGLVDLAESNETKIEASIRKISNCEISGTTNTEGYNSAWVERDLNGDIAGGECSSITNVLKSVVGATEGTTIDADSLSVTDMKAAEVSNIMKSINGSYLCTGVMNSFVKKAFTGGMGLESLLKYNTVDTDMVANFDLTYVDYGGSDNACGEGTEIYTFQKVLEAMQYEDTSGELKFVSLSDLSSAISKKPNCFDGIFYFLYNSNTLAAEYSGNTNIKGRDVLLYNALSSFDSYLIGSDKENKILAIEKIFDMTQGIDDDYYKVEANGITRMIDAAGNSISGITIDSLNSDPTTKEMILNVVKYTYDRNDGKVGFPTDSFVVSNRAYFASEIISGIFDDIITSEYENIASTFTASEQAAFTDLNKFYFAQKAGGGRATSASDITATVFDNLNETEKNGLDGMITMTTYINGAADRTGGTVADIATNPFVVAMTTNSATIRSLFTTKLHDATNNVDSRVAKLLYVSRGAKTVVNETTYADDSSVANYQNSGLLVLLKFATHSTNPLTDKPSNYVWKVSEGFTNDYYASSFGFDTYGNALMDYVNSCTATA